MDEKNPFAKIKEGVSVEELETFARKYTTEVFLILAVIIATISSIFDFFTGPGWSLSFTGIGAILSLAFPETIVKIQRKILDLIAKPEKSMQITVGIVRLIIALFIPFFLFAEMGFLAGLGFHRYMRHSAMPKTQPFERAKDKDEEHL
ncbi:MAG: hypothetical protein WC371_05650 [Parachlamydiales bacterium]|jgi:hypothetical protein